MEDSKNHGFYARIKPELVLKPEASQVLLETFNRNLQNDKAPAQIGQSMKGFYAYRILIEAPDKGYYSSFVLGFLSKAQKAFGKVTLDDGGNDVNKARIGVIE